MRKSLTLVLIASGALALSACSGSDSREAVHAVGSSTVYPFAVAVAEAAAQAAPEFPRALIESTGTGEGVVQFCAGAGLDTPDILNASRRMTRAEFEQCQANGVTKIVELQVGLDGIAFVSAREGGLSLALTPKIVYAALAANPFGDAQHAARWSDVDRALPGQAIEVLGPPTTSGTRDVLKELVLLKGCQTDDRMTGIELSEPERFQQVCTSLRTDGAYVEQGEQDELTVDKVVADRGAIAVLGYSYFEEHADVLKALPIDGIEPTYDTIASGEYPGARALYIYIKPSHVEKIAGLRTYLDQWVANWGKGGALTKIGFVAASDRTQARNRDLLTSLEPMTALGLN